MKFYIVPRIEKLTGRIVLCYKNRFDDGSRHWIELYDTVDEHTEIGMKYYRRKTKPVPAYRFPEVRLLFEKYTSGCIVKPKLSRQLRNIKD